MSFSTLGKDKAAKVEGWAPPFISCAQALTAAAPTAIWLLEIFTFTFTVPFCYCFFFLGRGGVAYYESGFLHFIFLFKLKNQRFNCCIPLSHLVSRGLLCDKALNSWRNLCVEDDSVNKSVF